MSKYTTELRYIIESGYDLGLKDYPLFTESYRSVLNNKILEHFKYREIGFETPSLFIYMLNRKMREIMPLYNQRYSSEPLALGISPIDNVNMTEEFTRTLEGNGTTITNGTNVTTGTTTNTDSASGDNLTVDSDTPQGSITDLDIKSNKYASKTSHILIDEDKTNTTNVNNTDDIDSTVTSDNTNSETYSRHTFGSSAGYTFAQNIQQWRGIMVNIDMEIIEELEELFIQLW